MHVRSVTTPSGQSYAVTVEWLPRWRLLAGRFSGWRKHRRPSNDGETGWQDFLPSFFDVDEWFVGLALLIGFIVFGLLFWWLLLPALLLVLDGLVVGLLLLLGIIARVALRRPWDLLIQRTDRDNGDPDTRIQVTGWRRALRTRDAIADALTAGASLAVATASPCD